MRRGLARDAAVPSGTVGTVDDIPVLDGALQHDVLRHDSHAATAHVEVHAARSAGLHGFGDAHHARADRPGVPRVGDIHDAAEPVDQDPLGLLAIGAVAVGVGVLLLMRASRSGQRRTRARRAARTAGLRPPS